MCDALSSHVVSVRINVANNMHQRLSIMTQHTHCRSVLYQLSYKTQCTMNNMQRSTLE